MQNEKLSLNAGNELLTWLLDCIYKLERSQVPVAEDSKVCNPVLLTRFFWFNIGELHYQVTIDLNNSTNELFQIAVSVDNDRDIIEEEWGIGNG